MPTVAVNVEVLRNRLGDPTLTEEKFADLCFQFGLELDDVQGDTFKVDIPANRYDLLCVEGIARALNIFLHPQPSKLIPNFKTTPATYSVKVSPTVSSIRPYITCAILRNVTLTQLDLESFIDLQDKLHHTLCRRRALASIGTYDLDKTVGKQFKYAAVPRGDIRFRPLSCPNTSPMDGHQIIEYLSNHMQLKHFVPLVSHSNELPLLCDENNNVLSLPPLINAEDNKLTVESKNIFIDCTATDPRRGELVLNTVVAMFSEYCAEPFQVEQVEIIYEDNESIKRVVNSESADDKKRIILPDLSPSRIEVDMKIVQSIIGKPNFTMEDTIKCLERMQIQAEITDGKCFAYIPITRSDIMHSCDIAEDVAISLGFNNLEVPEMPMVQRQPLAVLSESVREALVSLGYNECLNFALCSNAENHEFLCKTHVPPLPKDWNPLEYHFNMLPLDLANAKTRDFTQTRSQLITGIVKSLVANKGRREMPLRLFEIGDVVVLDPRTDVGSRNLRYCCVAYADEHSSGLEEVQGVLDALLSNLGLMSEYAIDEHKKASLTSGGDESVTIESLHKFRPFSLVPAEYGTFLPGRQVRIMAQPPYEASDLWSEKINNKAIQIGVLGTLHADVLQAIGINIPVSLLEITLEPFVNWIHPTELVF